MAGWRLVATVDLQTVELPRRTAATVDLQQKASAILGLQRRPAATMGLQTQAAATVDLQQRAVATVGMQRPPAAAARWACFSHRVARRMPWSRQTAPAAAAAVQQALYGQFAQRGPVEASAPQTEQRPIGQAEESPVVV